MPVLLLLLLGIIGVGYLFLSLLTYQNGVDVLARLAARGGEWQSVVAEENARTRCNASPLLPSVTYPDGDAEPGSRLLLSWNCHLRTGWMFDGWRFTVASEAVIEAVP
jgi:Flp pilus assembly protein TadG